MQIAGRNFRCEIDAAAGTATLSGDIDEHVNLVSLVSELKGSPVSFDLTGVRRINSPGVRNWISMIRSLDGRETVLRRCSPAIVQQLNWIREFRGNARVHSVLLPYVCEQCDSTIYHELEIASIKMPPELPPAPTCTECGGKRIFDDFVDQYLSFLSNG